MANAKGVLLHMKLICSKSNLLQGVNIVLKAVPAKTTTTAAVVGNITEKVKRIDKGSETETTFCIKVSFIIIPSFEDILYNIN